MEIIIKPKSTGRLDSAHLSPGQRDGLRQHEVTTRDFDRMDETSQREWVEELHMDSYAAMRNYHKKDWSGKVGYNDKKKKF